MDNFRIIHALKKNKKQWPTITLYRIMAHSETFFKQKQNNSILHTYLNNKINIPRCNRAAKAQSVFHLSTHLTDSRTFKRALTHNRERKNCLFSPNRMRQLRRITWITSCVRLKNTNRTFNKTKTDHNILFRN